MPGTLMVRTRLLDEALEYRRLKERVQSIIKNAKNCSWQKYCSTLNEKLQVKEVWTAARRMIGKAKAPTIPTLRHGDNVCCSDKEKAALLTKTYSDTSDTSNYPAKFQTYKYNFESKNNSFINKISLTENESHPMNKDFNMSELGTALDRCCDTSSPGQDNISYQIIKKRNPHCTLFLEFLMTSGRGESYPRIGKNFLSPLSIRKKTKE